MDALRLNVLVCIDDRSLDPPILEIFSGRSYSLTHVETGLEVAMYAQRTPPDLIVASASAPMLPGPEIARRLSSHPKTRGIPVFFLCTAPGDPQALAAAGVPAERCFRTPLDVPLLRSRVQTVLMRHSIAASASRATHLDGDLSKVPLPHLLMTLETTTPSGVLRLRKGSKEGYVVFKDGHVLNGYFEDLEGEDALLALLEWESGTFSFVQMEEDIQAPSLGRPSTLILECSRLLDEKSALAAHIPATGEVLRPAERPPAAPPDPEIVPVLARVDGQRSVEEVVRASGPYRTRTLLALASLVGGGWVLRTESPEAASGSEGRGIEIAPQDVARLAAALAAARGGAAGRFQVDRKARVAVFLASSSLSLLRSFRAMAADKLGGEPQGVVGKGRWVLDLSPETAIEFLEVSAGSYPAIAEPVRARLGAAVYLFSGLSIPDVGGARHFIEWARTWSPRLPVLLATYELDPDAGLSLWEIQTHVEKEDRVYFLPFREIGRMEMGLLVSSLIIRVAEEVEALDVPAASGGG